MGRIFIQHMGGTRLFSCASCETVLTNRDELISTRYIHASDQTNIYNCTKLNMPTFAPDMPNLYVHSRKYMVHFIRCLVRCCFQHLVVERCKMRGVMLCLVRCWSQRPVVERCYGLSARSRNESISACWPVRPAARGPALEIQMVAAIIPRQMTAAAAAFVHYSTVALAALTCFVRY